MVTAGGAIPRQDGPEADARGEWGPYAIPICRGPSAHQFDPWEVSYAARWGNVSPDMRRWARWDAEPGVTDIRVYSASQAVEAGMFPMEGSSPGQAPLSDERYAVDTLDGVMMEMHQSVASDGPLSHICTLFTELVMGTGFRPELVPIPEPGDDPDEDREHDDECRDAIAFLRAVDMQQGDDRSGLWPSMFGAVAQLVKMTTVYHRACLIKHGAGAGPAPTFGGEELDTVPRALEVVHPRDMGMVGLDSRNVPRSIYRNLPMWDRLNLEDIIYLHSMVEGSHVHNSWGFGLSPISGCIDAARLHDKIEKEDAPAALRVSWTNIPLVFANLPGGEGPQKAEQLRRLSSQLHGGGPTFVALPPESVKVEDLKMQPALDPMREWKAALLNYMAAHVGLPQVAVSEKDTTRAATSGKSNLMVQGTIQPRRERVGECLARQWYLPMLRERYPNVAKSWRVRVVFDNLDTESLAQKVEAISALDASWALKVTAAGRLLNIQGFKSMVDETLRRQRNEAQVAGPEDSSGAPARGGKNPGPGGGNRRNVGKPDEVNAS